MSMYDEVEMTPAEIEGLKGVPESDDSFTEELKIETPAVETPVETTPVETPAVGVETPVETTPVEQKPTEHPAVGVKPESGQVPIDALHAERERRKELENELAELRVKTKQLSEGFKALEEAKKQQPQPTVPDINDDPYGNFDSRIQNIEKFASDQTEIQNQNQQWLQQQQMDNQLYNAYMANAAAFSKTNPDFTDAQNHFISERTRQMSTLGYTQDQISQIVSAEERAIVAKALAEGINPASRIYNLAKQFNYQPGSEVSKQLDQVKNGMANESLSNTGSAGDGMGIDDILLLDGEAFVKAFNEYNNRQLG